MSKSAAHAVSRRAALAAVRALLKGVPRRWHFRVHRAFNVTVAPEWRILPRVIDDQHLIYTKAGQGRYYLDDRPVPLAAGRLAFVTAGLPHAADHNVMDPPTIMPVRFGCYDNRTGQLLPPVASPAGFGFHLARPLRFEALFERLYQAFSSGTDAGQDLCGAILHQILLELASELAAPAAGLDERVERVRQRLEADPARPAPLSALAREAGLSPKYFLRLFARQVGETPAVYRNHLRHQRAVCLLEDAGRSVKEVAALLGYPDAFTFSRQFRRFAGQPPSHLRPKPSARQRPAAHAGPRSSTG